jgi:hypothetical protein
VESPILPQCQWSPTEELEWRLEMRGILSGVNAVGRFSGDATSNLISSVGCCFLSRFLTSI